MFEKLKAFYNVFRAGQSVANAVGLKNKQLIGNAIFALLGILVSVGKIYGFDFHLSSDDLNHLAGVATLAVGLFNAGATVASTDKIGLSPRRELEQSVNQITEQRPAVPVVDHSTVAQSKSNADAKVDIWGSNAKDFAG